MSYLIIVQGIPKRIPNLTITFPIWIIAKATWIILQITISPEDVLIRTCIQSGFNLFDVKFIRVLTSAFNIIDSALG